MAISSFRQLETLELLSIGRFTKDEKEIQGEILSMKQLTFVVTFVNDGRSSKRFGYPTVP
jgi:hypothetical protein